MAGTRGTPFAGVIMVSMLYICAYTQLCTSYTRKLAHTYSWCMHAHTMRSSEIHTHAHTHLHTHTFELFSHVPSCIRIYTNAPTYALTLYASLLIVKNSEANLSH